jgi:hypothetical protein
VLPVSRELGIDPFGEKLNPTAAQSRRHPYGMTGGANHAHAAERSETLTARSGSRDAVSAAARMAMLVERL